MSLREEDSMTIQFKRFVFGVAVTVGLGLASSAMAQTTLRIGTVLAPNDPMGQGLDNQPG